MRKKTKILAFTGSLRRDSYNKRIVQTAMLGAEKAGAEVTFIDLLDYPMPIYNPDSHKALGFDQNALKFQGVLVKHDGFLIASPEYNGSLTAALKNAIDWASRPSNEYQKGDVFQGKFAAIMTASLGSFGGIRSLLHLRGVLMSVGVNVLSSEIAVPFVADKFDGNDGKLNDEIAATSLEQLGGSLVEMLGRLGLEKQISLN
jgi:chromate reductase, NAD(P)H dehydrogenase (quinone)